MLINSIKNKIKRHSAKCYQLYSIKDNGNIEHLDIDVLHQLREKGFDAVSYIAMGEISTYVFITPTEVPALEKQSKILSFEVAKSPVDRFLARMIAKHPAAL